MGLDEDVRVIQFKINNTKSVTNVV